MPIEQKIRFLDTLINATLRFLIASKRTNLSTKSALALELGIARIHKDNDEDRKLAGTIYIDETLALATIVKYLTHENRISWLTRLSEGAINNAIIGYVYEYQVIFLFLHYFGGQYTRFGDVFDFGDSEQWNWLKDRSATLVGVKSVEGQCRSFSISWEKAPHLPFGYDAPSGDRFAAALELCNGTAFFLPDNHCHPDIVCTFRGEDGETMCVIVQAKFTSGTTGPNSHVQKATFDDAIRTLEPGKFYERKAPKPAKRDAQGEVVENVTVRLPSIYTWRSAVWCSI